MSGRDGPTDAEMTKRLEKRLDGISKLDKRFNRSGTGVVKVSGSSKLQLERAVNSGVSSDKKTPDPKDGFPQVDLDASKSNGTTKGNKPTAANSIAFDIVCATPVALAVPELISFYSANDVGYVANVQIGTPPRNFSILMDSGSSDFWVGGEACVTGADSGGGCVRMVSHPDSSNHSNLFPMAQGNHTFLGPKSSSTFRNDTELTWGIIYGTGFVTGSLITDNVRIAGLVMNNYTFGASVAESSEFTDSFTMDGLMGLAKGVISNQRVPTPVEALAQKGLINQAITSYKISRLADGLNDGEITFGGLDQSKFDPSTLVTVDSVDSGDTAGFWEAPFTVCVDGKSLGLINRTAILDTGSTLITAPDDDVKAIHAKIPGSKIDPQDPKNYIIPCTNTAVVSFKFGGRAFDINPLDLAFFPVDEKNLKGDCYSGFSAGTVVNATQWL